MEEFGYMRQTFLDTVEVLRIGIFHAERFSPVRGYDWPIINTPGQLEQMFAEGAKQFGQLQ